MKLTFWALQASLATMTACHPAIAADRTSCLYWHFEFPADGGWTRVSTDLGFHGGSSVDGAAAPDAAALDALPQSLSLIVGGRCGAGGSEQTHYPCGFQLSEPALAGQPAPAELWDWSSTTGTAMTAAASGDGPASITAITDGTPATKSDGPQDLVGVQAPASFLVGWDRQPGTRFSFRFRAVASGLGDSAITPSGGTVALCGHLPPQRPERPL